MSKLKKIKILDDNAKNKYAYSDILGVFYTDTIYISGVQTGKRWISADEIVYKTGQNKYEKVSSMRGEDILNVFSQKLLTSARPPAKELQIDAVKIYVGCDRGYNNRSYYSSYYNRNDRTVVFNKKDINKLKTMSVYIREDGKDIELVPVNFGILKEGECVYFPEAGTCKILYLYEPNISGKLCKIESTYDKKIYEIQENGQSVYELPYKTHNIFGFLNIADNENLLKPFILGGNQTINVCWQGVDGASQYYVALYWFYQSGNTKKVYHLKNFIVDRNTTYLAITDLVEINRCIVTVSAENREGEIIAKSRGISFDNGGLPKFWAERG